MSKPRTPEHFPRMKVRGGRRRHDASVREAPLFDWAGLAVRVQAALESFAAGLRRIGESLTRMQEAYRVRSAVAARQRVNQWVATHQLPATPSPWAAPIEGARRG